MGKPGERWALRTLMIINHLMLIPFLKMLMLFPIYIQVHWQQLIMEANSLLRAITDNSVSDLAAILETGVDINRAVFCDTRGETVLPISFACAKGSVDVVKHLLQIGVDVNIPGIAASCSPMGL